MRGIKYPETRQPDRIDLRETIKEKAGLMEKINEALEDFLREIAPYASKAYPFITAFNDKYMYTDLVQKRTYLRELVALGFVDTTKETTSVFSSIDHTASVEFPDFFTLTSKGKTYFDEITKQYQLEEDAKKKQWRHDYKIAAFGVIGGGVAGGAVTLLLHFVFGL